MVPIPMVNCRRSLALALAVVATGGCANGGSTSGGLASDGGGDATVTGEGSSSSGGSGSPPIGSGRPANEAEEGAPELPMDAAPGPAVDAGKG
jgi:hypothetical protein